MVINSVVDIFTKCTRTTDLGGTITNKIDHTRNMLPQYINNTPIFQAVPGAAAALEVFDTTSLRATK